MFAIRISVIIITLTLTVFKVQAAEDSTWIKLFNGKDLKEWDFHIKGQEYNVDPKHTFKVVDGNLFVDYSEYMNWDGEPFGHLGYKLRTFSHYLLRGEYQFVGKQVTGAPNWAHENNGFMLHSQSIASMGKEQDFPISLEAQLLGSDSPMDGNMNLCTPGTYIHDMSGKLITDHCIGATKVPRLPAPDWTYSSALVLGDSLIKFMVGKDTVFKFTKPVMGGGGAGNTTVPIVENQPIKEGYILIQSESAPILFRKIEVLDLVGCMDKSKQAYRSYFVKSNPAACAVVTDVHIPSVFSEDIRISEAGHSLVIKGTGSLYGEIISLNGSLLGSSRGQNSVTLNLLNPKPGLYIVRVKTSEGTVTRTLPLFQLK